MLAEHGLMVISFFISIPHILGAGSITFVQLSQISRHVTTIEVLRKTQEQRQSHSGSTSISSTRELNPWDPAPSWKTRIRNIWNLLAFDKFGSEEVSYQSDISFDTLSSRAI
uniref:Secreted protein n=1 Tax=Caenorhabditis tropicalis TaxID=1561998 RepID=A0A1I7T456_9PELO